MTVACGIAMCVRVKGVIQMQITDIRIRSVEKEGKMKAVVSITIDDEFVVHDIRVRRACSSRCRVERQRMENIEISLIRSIQLQESVCRV